MEKNRIISKVTFGKCEYYYQWFYGVYEGIRSLPSGFLKKATYSLYFSNKGILYIRRMLFLGFFMNTTLVFIPIMVVEIALVQIFQLSKKVLKLEVEYRIFCLTGPR